MSKDPQFIQAREAIQRLILEAKFEYEKEFKLKVLAPVVDYLINNSHYSIEAEIRHEIFDQQSEAIAKINETLNTKQEGGDDKVT
jgi:hypothetical protein